MPGLRSILHDARTAITPRSDVSATSGSASPSRRRSQNPLWTPLRPPLIEAGAKVSIRAATAMV